MESSYKTSSFCSVFRKRIGVRTDLHGGEGGMLKGCYWEVAIWSSAHGISGIDGRNLLLPLSLK